MRIKSKLLSCIMAAAMAFSAVALPAVTAGAEAYVNKSLIYVDNSDFTDISIGLFQGQSG